MAVYHLASILSSTACSTSDLRGSFKPSHDGKTYLVVDDDNGGSCPINVDEDLVVPHRSSSPIEPGRHKIEICGEIGFEVRRGVVYRFNYWGP